MDLLKRRCLFLESTLKLCLLGLDDPDVLDSMGEVGGFMTKIVTCGWLVSCSLKLEDLETVGYAVRFACHQLQVERVDDPEWSALHAEVLREIFRFVVLYPFIIQGWMA